jgi:tetratricopeptide (TPR) repeat protein
VLVLQIFPVGNAVMADRYTYLSSFGIFLVAASGYGYLSGKYPSQKTLLLGLFMAYAALLGAGTVKRAGVWQSSYTFWNDVMEKYPGFYPAINNLGVLYKDDGKTEEAIRMFSQSIGVYEKNPVAYFHRGSLRGKSGQLQEAIADLDMAIRYQPDFIKAYSNRAIAKAMLKDYPGAVADLDRVVAREKSEEAYINRGTLRNEMKEFALAIRDFGEAVKINPSCANCYYALGFACYRAARYPDAVKAFTACIGLNPSADYAYYYRALSNIETGENSEVCSDLEQASRLGVSDARPALEKYCRR